MEWVDWILSCVTSPSFSVLINGEPTDLFLASRGIRQGDLISSYLFIIMAEGLGRFIKFQATQGIVQGLKWHIDIPAYTHLQFVDDIGLMGLATINEERKFRWILDTYLKASRQQINEGKSIIYFFNTPQSI